MAEPGATSQHGTAAPTTPDPQACRQGPVSRADLSLSPLLGAGTPGRLPGPMAWPPPTWGPAGLGVQTVFPDNSGGLTLLGFWGLPMPLQRPWGFFGLEVVVTPELMARCQHGHRGRLLGCKQGAGRPSQAALSSLFPLACPPEWAVLVVTGLPWQGLRANLSCRLLCKTGASHLLWRYRRCMHEVQSVCVWRA